MLGYLKKNTKQLADRSSGFFKADMRYMAKNGFWNTLVFVISSFFSLALVISFANFLPKELYGTYKYIMSIAGSLGFLTLTGMNTAVTQAVARGEDAILRYAVRVQLKWNGIFFLGTVGIAGYYAWHNSWIIATSLFILAVGFPLISTYNTYGAFLAGKKNFQTASMYGIISNAFFVGLMVLALFLTHQVIWIITAYVAGNLLPLLFFYKRTLDRYHVPVENGESKKDFLKYSAHLTVVNILATLSQYVDKIVIFHFLGAVQLAVYSLALAMPERIRGYAKNLLGITFPKLAERSFEEIKRVFYLRVLQTFILGALIAVAYIVAAPWIFRLILPKYLEGITYSRVVALTLIFTFPAGYMGNIFRAQKMMGVLYASSTVAHLTKIILFIILGALYGIWGVVIALVATYSLGFFYNLVLWHYFAKREGKKSLLERDDKGDILGKRIDES